MGNLHVNTGIRFAHHRCERATALALNAAATRTANSGCASVSCVAGDFNRLSRCSRNGILCRFVRVGNLRVTTGIWFASYRGERATALALNAATARGATSIPNVAGNVNRLSCRSRDGVLCCFVRV